MSKELPFLVYVFEEYRYQKGLNGKEAIALFNQYQVCEYIRDYYESLHTTGINYIIDDIDKYIDNKKKNL